MVDKCWIGIFDNRDNSGENIEGRVSRKTHTEMRSSKEENCASGKINAFQVKKIAGGALARVNKPLRMRSGN
jgi:hypothetical protein